MQAVYLGHRLGWYDALAEHGAMTSGELATRSGASERYAREWLEHQAVCDYLTVDDAAAVRDRQDLDVTDPACVA